MIKDTRQSLQLRADQVPLIMINKRDQRIKSFYVPNDFAKRQTSTKEEKRKSNIKLLQLISNQQQQQYEVAIQTLVLNNEIAFLSEKLTSTEEMVSKWKNDFKDLHSKFIQVLNTHHDMRQELEDTRRMLAESEHIRSRWFLKTTQHCDGYVTQPDLPKKIPPPHQHHR